MAQLNEIQRKVINQFINRTGNLAQSGFAYALAHPEVAKKLQCESKKIEEMEAMFGKMTDKPCYEKMMRDAYIRYFVMLTKLGFKFIEHHPDYFDDVVKLQSFFNDYDRACKDNKTYVIKQDEESESSDDSTENVFYDTYQKLSELCAKVDSMKTRINRINEPRRCNLKKSHENGMRILNKELKEKLREIKREKKSRIFNKNIASDSDEISSEEMINFNDLMHNPKPLFNSTMCQKNNPTRIGPIERNIVIPLNDYPDGKISPKFLFKRDDRGNMTFDVNLNFENGLLYNDRIANGISIKNNLLPQVRRNNRNFRFK